MKWRKYGGAGIARVGGPVFKWTGSHPKQRFAAIEARQVADAAVAQLNANEDLIAALKGFIELVRNPALAEPAQVLVRHAQRAIAKAARQV